MDIVCVAFLVLGSVVLFVTEAVRVDIVALIVLSAVMAFGLATPKEALAGFSNPATVTVAAMFVLSAGLDRTGTLIPLSNWISKLILTRGVVISLLALTLVTGLLSAFINNTAAVAIFLPAVMSATKEAGASPSRFLLPLSFVSMAGGTITLIGTSTNLIVNGVAVKHGLEQFSLFEFAPLGCILLIVSLIYSVTLGLRLTPERRKPRQLTEEFEMDSLPSSQTSDLEGRKAVLLEAAVGSSAENTTLRATDVKKAFDAVPLAVRRRGRIKHRGLDDYLLKSGDTILFQVERARLDQLRLSGAFLVLSHDERQAQPRQAAVAVSIVVGVVLIAALNLAPIVVSSAIGALAMVMSKSLTTEEAYRAIDWKIIILLAGMLSLGSAMETTGAASVFADAILHRMLDVGPQMVLGVLYLLTTLLTAGMSNNATAALLAPVAISLAHGMGVSSRPFLVAVAFAASACFSSPIGYQTNLMVYGPGRFKFIDFVKVGAPLNLAFLLLSVFLIPLIWKF